MSELDIQVPGVYDPFADANIEDSDAGTKEYVHVRIQQRNGRKSLTTVQGVKKDFNYNKILKDFKKEFCCNGTVVQDTELGQDVTGGGGAMRCNEMLGKVQQHWLKFMHQDLYFKSSLMHSI